MHILYIILVLLIITRLFGELAERVGQPSLLGELVSGIFLGILIHYYGGEFPTLAGLPKNEVFIALTDLGIFFLMLLGGIEMHPRDLVKASGSASIVALFGMLVPLGIGMGFGWLILPESPYRFAQTLFLGTALAITAVPVAIKVLMDMKMLETDIGQMIVSAAVIDDVLSLVLLAVMTAMIETGALPDGDGLLLLGGKVVLFFVIATLLGRYIFPLMGRRLKKARAEEFEFSALLVAALAYALLAEKLGMHFILGAFLAGLFFVRRTIDDKTYNDIFRKTSALTTGFLAPIFFASIGMRLELAALWNIPGLVILLILAATVGKVVGAGASAKLMGFSTRESLAVGSAMNARGAVELIVADIALRAGLFSLPEPPPPEVSNLFSAVVIMAVVTTLITPPALKIAMPSDGGGK
ncbi:MAG: cation:proton antiporter [Desulfuromonadales bacterium]|nr:cation:proton antiporter [Desulfuromonadales bacterium]NIR33672.1 cation:proton antiporter [Desulfuromonadales bacterium]NIS41283.1 cation:proton antiporter [Desulfuromonadales bacterium]